jgi:hypothetical protein
MPKTLTASFLTDAANVYTLNKNSAALFADIHPGSFHRMWQKCYDVTVITKKPLRIPSHAVCHASFSSLESEALRVERLERRVT